MLSNTLHVLRNTSTPYELSAISNNNRAGYMPGPFPWMHTDMLPMPSMIRTIHENSHCISDILLPTETHMNMI